MSSTTIARPAPGLVLTRRGRRTVRLLAWSTATALLTVGLVLLWLTAAATLAPGASAGDGDPGVVSAALEGPDAQELAAVEVAVRPGDTLWSLAVSHAPARDPRSVVHDIARLNGLSGNTVQAGALLLVPTR